jgi:hypothetical protein
MKIGVSTTRYFSTFAAHRFPFFRQPTPEIREEPSKFAKEVAVIMAKRRGEKDKMAAVKTANVSSKSKSDLNMKDWDNTVSKAEDTTVKKSILPTPSHATGHSIDYII